VAAQTDLRVEAVHLRRFYRNFASVRSSVTPPLPIPGMDTEAVLVETFEAGLCSKGTLVSLKFPPWGQL
jgi:aarF domain-containing kinase